MSLQYVSESLSERIHLAEGLMSGTENSQGSAGFDRSLPFPARLPPGTPRHMPPPTPEGPARQGLELAWPLQSGILSPAFPPDPPWWTWPQWPAQTEAGKSVRRFWKLAGSLPDNLCSILKMCLPLGEVQSERHHQPGISHHAERVISGRMIPDNCYSSRKQLTCGWDIILHPMGFFKHHIQLLATTFLNMNVLSFCHGHPMYLLDLDLQCKAKDTGAGITHLVAWAAALPKMSQCSDWD